LPVAISDQQFVADYLRQVFDGRLRLQSLCSELSLRCWPSYTNFVLVEVGAKHGEFISSMRKKGISLRDRSNDPGCEGCMRITIGTAEQNAILFEAIKSVLVELGIAKKVSA
jgi:histidinol-phosphate aminotransferase